MISNETIKDLVKYFKAKENRTNEENEFLDTFERYEDAFPITAVMRDDLKELGFDISNVSDDKMDELAARMADDYCEQLFWSSLEIIAEDGLNIPKIDEEDEEDEY